MIVAIVGSMGSGKTLTMTYLAYRAHKSGRNILTNYALKFAHTLITKKQIMNYSEDNTLLRECLLNIDEAQIILDCRTHQKNRLITYFLLQTRKRDVDLHYTTQQFWNVEKRLRENTDFIMYCEPVKDGNKKLVAIRIELVKYLGKNTFKHIRFITLTNPEQVYELYDSYNIIDFTDES